VCGAHTPPLVKCGNDRVARGQEENGVLLDAVEVNDVGDGDTIVVALPVPTAQAAQDHDDRKVQKSAPVMASGLGLRKLPAPARVCCRHFSGSSRISYFSFRLRVSARCWAGAELDSVSVVGIGTKECLPEGSPRVLEAALLLRPAFVGVSESSDA